jgi:hypothetical protein
MKYRIKKRVLLEALKDDIPVHQRKLVRRYWGDKVLDMDVEKEKDVIPEGKFRLSEDEKETFLSNFFDIELNDLKNKVKQFNPDIHFWRIMLQSIEDNSVKSSLNFNKSSIYLVLHNIIKLNKNDLFYSLDVNAIKNGKMKMLDDKGKPIIKDGKPIFVDYNNKNIPILNKNRKTNLLNFIKNYNEAYNKNINVDFIENLLKSGVKDVLDSKNFDLDLFADKPMFIYITSKPEDVLNMSLSKFYNSCQNLYNGIYKESLISTVFEKKTKVCYIIYDEPFIDDMGNKIPFTSIARRLLRVIEGDEVYFDVIYPNMNSRLYEIFDNLLKNKIGLKKSSSNIFKPDIPKNLPKLYLDKPLKLYNDYKVDNEIKSWIEQNYKNYSVNVVTRTEINNALVYRASLTRDDNEDRRWFFVRKADLLSFSIDAFWFLHERAEAYLDYNNYIEDMKEDGIILKILLNRQVEPNDKLKFYENLAENFELKSYDELDENFIKYVNDIAKRGLNIQKDRYVDYNDTILYKSFNNENYLGVLSDFPFKIDENIIIYFIENLFEGILPIYNLHEFLNENINLYEVFSNFNYSEVYDLYIDYVRTISDYIIKKEYANNGLFELYSNLEEKDESFIWNVEIEGENYLLIDVDINTEIT